MKLRELHSHFVTHPITVIHSPVWSEDDTVAVATEKDIQIMKETQRLAKKRSDIESCESCTVVGDSYRKVCERYSDRMEVTSLLRGSGTVLIATLFALILMPFGVECIDMTSNVFGSLTDGMPAAFGHFDSDKFTDLFVLRDNGRTVEILLGGDTEPLLRRVGNNLTCTFPNHTRITSVVPGDFDGDAFMDVLVTVHSENVQRFEAYPFLNYAYMLWGNGAKLSCNITKPIFMIHGQPLAMDYDQDMVMDLFGVVVTDSMLQHAKNDGEGDEERGFWIFNQNRTEPRFLSMNMPKHLHLDRLKVPHSHGFLDLNGDSYGDLYLTTRNGNAEIWFYNKHSRNFIYNHTIPAPPGVDLKKDHYIGQTIFQDMGLQGRLDILVPVCFDDTCKNGTLFLYANNSWHNIKVQFNDYHMIHPNNRLHQGIYRETLTLRPGDYNMDGFPDLLATLVFENKIRTFLLQNVECDQINNCDGFSRTFKVRDTIPASISDNAVLGVFFDFLQDGVLDIIFVREVDKKRSVTAFRNSLDYDADFVKVMVVTGVMNNKFIPGVFDTSGTKKIYGTNLPGSTILYHTTTQEGSPRSAISTQLPQSAYFSLNLPYTIFGLGRTPNFVDEMIVGVYGHEHIWTQVIPNSQLVVIPRPPDDPAHWKVQLFVTPSKLILQSAFSLLGTCGLILLIIGVLHWKERKEDHKEKLQEAQKFHFDAM